MKVAERFTFLYFLWIKVIFCFFQVSNLANHEGEVTKDEFLNYAKHSEFFKTQLDKTASDSLAHKEEAIAKAERAFRLFDKDNDGYLSCFKQCFAPKVFWSVDWQKCFLMTILNLSKKYIFLWTRLQKWYKQFDKTDHLKVFWTLICIRETNIDSYLRYSGANFCWNKPHFM